jgi:hypothetical protein
VGVLIRESRIALRIVLGETLVQLIKDDAGLRIHDAEAVLVAGEVVVG